MRNILSLGSALALLLAACGGVDGDPSTTDATESTVAASSTTSSTTTSTTTTTTSTTAATTTTATTTTLAPEAGADPDELVVQIVGAIGADRFFAVDSVTEGPDPLEYPPVESCDDPEATSIASVADGLPEPRAVAHGAIRLSFADYDWTILVADYGDQEPATSVIAAMAAAYDRCPSGEQRIPIENADGTPLTDESGNPIFVVASLTNTPLDVDAPGLRTAGTTAIDFADAAGDTTIYRAAVQRGTFLIYVSGHDSEANLERLLALIDDVIGVS